MSTFNKFPNSAKWIIAILLLMNILCIATLWFGRPGGKQHSRMHKKLIKQVKKELNLSEQQTLDLDAMVKRQRQEQDEVKKELRKLKQELRIAASATPPDTLNAQNIAQEIGLKHTKLELNVIRHLEEIKSICQPGQLEKLHSIIIQDHQRVSKK